jgi:2-polyprenyl-3-methyl-5-hydroxy-6-metoxy-1,4-benzoquinol methylase
MSSGGLIETLHDLEFVEASDVAKVYYPRVRDRDDITVHRSEKSGVIFLVHDRTEEQVGNYYEQKDALEYWQVVDYEGALKRCARDDERRAHQFRDDIKGKHWVDVGSGIGGVVRLSSGFAKSTCAVEPQPAPRALMERHLCSKSETISVAKEVSELVDGRYDVATLFHVMEHLADPIGLLTELRTKMCAGAKLIVEVPHARDTLIVDHDCEAFKAWTFWSEHLVLHTRDSLRAFIEAAGFSDVEIIGYQRYGLANHLRWLSEGEKGGHDTRAHWSSEEVDSAYARHLDEKDRTDTLIAVAVNRI